MGLKKPVCFCFHKEWSCWKVMLKKQFQCGNTITIAYVKNVVKVVRYYYVKVVIFRTTLLAYNQHSSISLTKHGFVRNAQSKCCRCGKNKMVNPALQSVSLHWKMLAN